MNLQRNTRTVKLFMSRRMNEFKNGDNLSETALNNRRYHPKFDDTLVFFFLFTHFLSAVTYVRQF